MISLFSGKVYQTVSVHLIRQPSADTFPVQGKASVIVCFSVSILIRAGRLLIESHHRAKRGPPPFDKGGIWLAPLSKGAVARVGRLGDSKNDEI